MEIQRRKTSTYVYTQSIMNGSDMAIHDIQLS